MSDPIETLAMGVQAAQSDLRAAMKRADGAYYPLPELCALESALGRYRAAIVRARRDTQAEQNKSRSEQAKPVPTTPSQRSDP